MPSLRYYAFVARFVDSVTTHSLLNEMVRLRRDAAPQPEPMVFELPARLPEPAAEAA